MINVLIVFPRIDDARSIRSLLMKYGFQVTGAFTAGAKALQQAHNVGSGVVVCGYQFADMIYRDLKASLPETFKMVLMTSKHVEAECEEQGITLLRMPFKPLALIQCMQELEARMAAERRRRRMHPKIRSRQDQETIERAKQLLREEKQMDEATAHRYLQQCSMDNGTGLVETAEMILRLGGR